MANTFTDRQAIDMIRGIFPKCRIIKLYGYADGNNDYQKAKTPYKDQRGFTSPEFKQASDDELIAWMAQKGWIGLVIPLGHIIVDFDTSDAQAAIDMLDQMRVIRHTIKTPRGHQVIFKDTKSVATQRTKQLTKAGFIVDYRLANKGYIVLPSEQTDGRYWIKIEQDPIVDMLDLFDPIKNCEAKDRPFEIPLGEGSRNDTLFRHAGRLCKHGVPEERVKEIIHDINDYLTYPSVDEREMAQILRPDAMKGAKSEQTWAEFNASLDLIGAPKDESRTERKGPIFERSDVGNGERLVHHYGDRLRYVDKQSTWYLWDGMRWIADDTREIEIMAKETAETILHDAHGQSDEIVKEIGKHYMKSRRLQGIRAMIEMAKSERTVAVTHQIFDNDQVDYKLNVLNGTIDLRSGELLKHDRLDHMTKIANVEYDPMAHCPTWIKFLERIMQDEHGQVQQDLIEFLQRMIGYALTGSTSEQLFFILHGSGSNGKSTFFSAIEQILGEYAEQADASTFMVKNNQGVPNDIARLKGCRMVQTSETENNKPLAESLVKQLTGGDKIVARFLHQEFFEFKPKFKILFATNHKPRIKGNDHAIWRRIRLIPFKQTIGDDEKDPQLVNKLQAEASGILRWAIDGCLKWQQDGLKAPQAVIAATQAYRAEMDFIQAFFDEHIQIDKQAKTSNKDLYAAYRNYANESGEFVVSLRIFVEKIKEKIEIEDLPIRHVKDKYGVHWIGIKLIERDIFNETIPSKEGSRLHVVRQS